MAEPHRRRVRAACAEEPHRRRALHLPYAASPAPSPSAARSGELVVKMCLPCCSPTRTPRIGRRCGGGTTACGRETGAKAALGGCGLARCSGAHATVACLAHPRRTPGMAHPEGKRDVALPLQYAGAGVLTPNAYCSDACRTGCVPQCDQPEEAPRRRRAVVVGRDVDACPPDGRASAGGHARPRGSPIGAGREAGARNQVAGVQVPAPPASCGRWPWPGSGGRGGRSSS
jgi:hypothetical protein